MPGAGTAGDRGAGHPFADVRRLPERHQVGQPRRGPGPAGNRVRGLRVYRAHLRLRLGLRLRLRLDDVMRCPGSHIAHAARVTIYDREGFTLFSSKAFGIMEIHTHDHEWFYLP